MRRSGFSEEQINWGAEGARGWDEDPGPLPEARDHDATLYNWKARYGGMLTSDVAKQRSLEDENRRLKKLLAEQMLDNAVLKDLLEKNVWSAPSVQGSVSF